MAFKKIYLRINDKSADFDYLRDMGYMCILGHEMPAFSKNYYKDEERNAFLICLGSNRLSFEGNNDRGWVLCVCGKPVGIRTSENFNGTYAEGNYEKEFIIADIKYPENWTSDDSKDFKELLFEALKTEAYYCADQPDRVKGVGFKVLDDVIL